MKKTLMVIGLALILVLGVLVLAGCEKSENGEAAESKGIIGSWEYVTGGYTYIFNEDKTGSYVVGETKMEFTYEDDGTKVSILYTGNTDASEYEYRIEGNKLIIKDSLGSDVEYVKK